MTPQATTPATTPEETKEGPFSQAVEGLPDEFACNNDPKGDACTYASDSCCYQGCSERLPKA